MKHYKEYLSIVLNKVQSDLINILVHLVINVEQILYIADILFTLNMHFLTGQLECN